MAYSTTNPPVLSHQPIAGPRFWTYTSCDGSTVILTTTGYFSNGVALGMKLGDIVLTQGDSGGTTRTFGLGVISSVNSTAGSAAGALLSLIWSTT